MTISNDQKIDYLWKKLGYGRTKTDTSSVKDAVNESISSPLLIRGDTVWTQANLIPTTIPGSSTSVVTLYPTSLPIECTVDITASSNRTWKTNITDWIPPEIGSTYLVKVYVHTSGNAATAAASGTQVFATGSGNNDEWFFDYQSGVLNFIGTNLPNGVSFAGKSVYISGAVYSGQKGVTATGTAVSFSNIYASGIITASQFYGDGSGLSGVSASKWSTTNSGIHTLSNVGIGTTNPTQNLDVKGSVKISERIYDFNNNPGGANYVLSSGGPSGSWTWLPVTDVGAGTLDAVFIRQNGSNVGNGTVTTFDFYENFSVTQPSAGIASIRINKVNLIDASTISVNSSTDALRITQTGAGNALVVEDETNPDTTPFVVSASGNVGIGTTNPSEELHIVSSQPLIRFTETDGAADNRNWNVGVNNQEFYWQALTDAGSGGGNLFKMTRSAAEIQTFEGRNAGNTWFITNNNTQRVGIGTSIASAVLDVRGNPWFSPNTTGVKATALRLGRFVDGVNAAFDILTDDNTGDDIEIQSNRYTGKIRFSRSSPSGIQTTFILDSNYLTGTSISIADTTGTSIKIKLDEAGNTFFNNSGAVLVGTISSTGTASQPLQVTGGAYVSTRLGVGVTNPAANTQVAIAGTLGIDAVGNTGTRTLLSSSGAGFVLNHNDNSNIDFKVLNGTKLQYQYSPNFWTIPAGIPFLVGTASSTGTANQLLRVEGGAYVSGNLGVGKTNPGAKLDVAGDIRLSSAGPEIEFNTGGPRLSVPSANTLTIHTGGGLDSTTNEAVRINTTGVGIGTTNPTSKLSVVGNGNFTGVVTATTFIGALTGTATTASSVTVDSVGLGTHTYGDYVKDITGTANQITVTSGTGEGSSPTLSIPSQFTAPEDVTVTRDLQVNRNLNVNGNITIGGTSATLFTTEFKVYDPDIVLGFRTDGSGNDVSNDNTANHGGIAIASTEGTPLISLYDVGIGETNPATYKKFMWFKSGTFSGLGTDAWISNYAIGIGSTQVPNGVRLAAGGMQVTDRTLSVPQLNISDVSTFVGIVELDSGLRDIYNNVGAAGSILVSTGAGVSWTAPFTAGIQGLQGLQGLGGSQGTQGVQGLEGSQGTQGTNGFNGAQGTTGSQGTQGTNGSNGAQGTTGSQGTNGSNGAQGTTGSQGTTGTGTQGTQGTTGSGGSITDDTSTDSTYYPVFVNSTSGIPSQTSVSSTNLQYNPSTGTLSATVFTSLSDKTQKTNIRPIDNSIELVKQLEGVRYDWINNDKPSIGVIAQDIEKILPEVVETNSNGLKSVSYGNIVGVLIEAIKEQQVRIEELERKLNA